MAAVPAAKVAAQAADPALPPANSPAGTSSALNSNQLAPEAAAPIDLTALPLTPDAMPNVLNGASKLWEVPIPEPVLDAPVTPPTTPVPIARSVTAPIPVTSDRLAPQQDPVARTALSGARSNAESLTDGVGGMPSPQDAAYLPAKRRPPGVGFVFGPGTVYPTLSFGASYQNGRNTREPLQATFGGAFSFSLGEPASGRTVNFDYGALARYPKENPDSRVLDQQLTFRALLAFTKLRLGLGVSYAGLSGVSRDVGRSSDRDLLTISGSASYELSVKTSLDLDVSIPVREFSDGVDSAGVTTTEFINYRYSPKTTVGIGLSEGVLTVNGGDSQTFGQFLTRLSLASTEVLAFIGTFGVDFRDAGDTKKVTPVFGLGAAWAPRLGTSFTLSADRRPQNSATATTENFVTTSFTITATQRLGSRMALQLTAGYEDAQYYSLSSTVTSNRRDHLYVGSAGLSGRITEHLNASLQYSYTQNNSNIESFDESRAQFQLNYNF